MEHVELDGVRVEYELHGDGEPVILPHARPFVTWYRPLVRALPDRAVLRYRREPPGDRSFGIEDDARLCTGLLAHLGIERPHVVGHSYGGLVALELVRRRRLAARSLTLLEPASVGLLAPEVAAARTAPLLAAARTAGAASAMDGFLRSLCGSDGPEVLERLVPGSVDDATAHADGFFAVELPAAVRWSFPASAAADFGLPVLHVRGAASPARFVEAKRSSDRGSRTPSSACYPA